MSRTYRNLKPNKHRPKWSQTYFNKFQQAHGHKRPEPYLVTQSIYEYYTETYEVKAEPIYVSKGTPMAKPEMAIVQVVFKAIDERTITYPAWRETGRYIIQPKPIIKTRQRRRYMGPNPDFSHDEWRARWDLERAFDHYRKNRTGWSGKRKQYDKRRVRRDIRLEGQRLCYEAAEDFSRHQQAVAQPDRDTCVYYWNAFNNEDMIQDEYDDSDWFYQIYLDDLEYERNQEVYSDYYECDYEWGWDDYDDYRPFYGDPIEPEDHIGLDDIYWPKSVDPINDDKLWP